MSRYSDNRLLSSGTPINAPLQETSRTLGAKTIDTTAETSFTSYENGEGDDTVSSLMNLDIQATKTTVYRASNKLS